MGKRVGTISAGGRNDHFSETVALEVGEKGRPLGELA